MLEDEYGNKLSTQSQPARDAYVNGVNQFLSSTPGAESYFCKAIEEDKSFALAHIGIARCRLLMSDRENAVKSVAIAQGLKGKLSAREAIHVEAIERLVSGDGPGAYNVIRSHVAENPRDVMIAQTCTSVFGLIGFSGKAGREAEQLAYTSFLAPYYNDDWWYLGMHAFAQCEVGQLDVARETIERALEGNPRSAQNAHVSAHIFYETGENTTGLSFLKTWWKDYGKAGALHGHISWHIALWTAAKGDEDTAWKIIDEYCKPDASEGPPLNILTDTVSFLHRVTLSGIDVPKERWQEISNYAFKSFPDAGIGFADIHSALAHSMADNEIALERLTKKAKGPAADIISPVWSGFKAFRNLDWNGVEEYLGFAMSGHERLGGSRAQRDLLEFSLIHALRKQGRHKEAERLVLMRRPFQYELASN